MKSSISPSKSTKSVSENLYPDNDVNNFFESCLNTWLMKFAIPLVVTVEGLKLKSGSVTARSLKTAKEGIRKRRVSPIYVTVSDEKDNKGEKNKAGSSAMEITSIPQSPLEIKVNYNSMRQLIELEIVNYRLQCIPRAFMQLLNLMLPYLKDLIRLTIKRCHINQYIIYEINKSLLFSSITEICLDDSCIEQSNYYILLEHKKLQNLSLCRCKINDVVCQKIFARLEGFESAAMTLAVLNLSSNSITDLSAKSIEEALRTNRVLRYLNLADNQLTDEGAYLIIKSLKEFRLEESELVGKRRRHIEYLKRKISIYNTCIHECSSISLVADKKFVKKKKSVTNMKMKSVTPRKDENKAENTMLKTEMMVKELIGPFQDPFKSENVTKVEDDIYCTGNLTLCYLNLAYNNLSYLTLTKLQNILEYQQNFTKFGNCGLIAVVLDGNYMPEQCSELKDIKKLLVKKRAAFSNSDRRKSQGVNSGRRTNVFN